MLSPMIRTMIVCLALSLPTGAFSQDRERPFSRRALTEDRVVQIARGYGMVEVEEIERDDDDWEIEGRDRRGRKLTIDINREGRVTRVDRDEDDDRDDDD